MRRGAFGYDSPVARSAVGMSWFDKLMPSRIRTEKRKHSVPEGLWVKCAG